MLNSISVRMTHGSAIVIRCEADESLRRCIGWRIDVARIDQRISVARRRFPSDSRDISAMDQLGIEIKKEASHFCHVQVSLSAGSPLTSNISLKHRSQLSRQRPARSNRC